MSQLGSSISTVLGATVLASLVTGFFYLLLAGVAWARDQKLQSGIWFYKDLRDRLKNTVAAIRTKQRDGDVREVVEKLTEKLVGGSLDYVRISQLSNHPTYAKFMEKYQGVLSLTLSRLSCAVQCAVEGSPPPREDAPKSIHLQLKGLIKEIIHEARDLPLFKSGKKNSKGQREDLSTKTYEDILATAILNKIVEQFQFHPKKEKDTVFDMKAIDEAEFSDATFSEELGDVRYDSGSDDYCTESGSLIYEDLSHGNATTDRALGDCPGFRAESRAVFPELGLDLVEGEAGNPQTQISTSVDSWEENWLFKKKKLRSKTQSPVAMLVPCPVENVKAQIGDMDADEMSDLSDCSDSELVHLVDSNADQIRHQETSPQELEISLSDSNFNNCENEASYQSDHGSSEGRESGAIDDLCNIVDIAETRNFKIIADPYSGEESLGIEQDGEYTEAYESSERRASSEFRFRADGYPRVKVKQNACRNGDKRNGYDAVIEFDARENAKSKPSGGGGLTLPNVRLLAKQFAGKHCNQKVHSLTARNLSRGHQDHATLPSGALTRNATKRDGANPRTNIHRNIEFWENISKRH